MKTTKRILSLLLALALCIGTFAGAIIPAHAADGDKGTVYMVHFPRGNDSNQTGWGHSALIFLNGWETESTSIFAAKALGSFSGKTVYCIEMGVPLWEGDQLEQKGETYWDTLPENINATIETKLVKNFIGRILQYGWTGNNSTTWVSTNAADREKLGNQIATQLLIWETVIGERDADFTHIKPPAKVDAVLDMIANDHPCRAEILDNYSRIVTAVQSHTKLPSFCANSTGKAQIVDLTWDGAAYSATLTDTNGVLESYTFTANVSGITFKKDGNKLRISSNSAPADTVTITAEKANSKRKGLVVWTDYTFDPDGSGQIQDLVDYTAEVSDPVSGYLKAKVGTGSLEIIKTTKNNGGAVSGFDFEVRNAAGTLIGTYTTTATGKIDVPNLPVGTYSVKEINVSNDFVTPTPNPKSVTILAGQTATVSFDNVKKLGVITVKKSDANPTMGGYSLAGAVFEICNSSGTLVDTITTNSSGTATSTALPLGTYSVTEKTAPTGFVRDKTTHTATLSGSQGTADIVYAPDVSIAEQPQVGTITVTKFDSATGATAQGDSTLNGAVFELYDSTKKTVLETLNCGNSTSATSKQLPLGTYYVKEKVPPIGYTLDNSWHEVKLEYGDQNAAVIRANAEIENKVIQGQIALVKHLYEAAIEGNAQVEQPLVGAVFQVYLKSAGSYDKALPTEKDLLTTDENGYAQTKLLPYGRYTVREISAPGDVKLAAPFDVFIAQDGNIYRYILSDPNFRSLVKIVKVDAETGRTIPTAGVQFKVKDLSSGEWISQNFNYPKPTIIDVFETAPDGTLVMPESLKSGEYELHEISAPWGYVLSETPVKFTIHSTQSDPEICVVTMENAPARGIISLEKRGNMLTNAAVVDTDFGAQYSPIFSLTGLQGAVFNVVTAAEIRTPDGSLRYAKGIVLDTITTDKNGRAVSIPLLLGDYELVEIEAPDGFVLDETPQQISLIYEGQNVPVVSTQIGIVNARQSVEIRLDKFMETTLSGDDFSPYADVVFGLFAGENIKNIDGETVIAKDALVALIHVDKNGNGVFSGELPFAKYYAKELQTNEYYQLNAGKYPAVAEYAGGLESVAIVEINDGNFIYNDLKAGQISIVKTGEILVCASAISGKNESIYSPEYAVRGLADVTFDVVAAENIYDVNGAVLHKKGAVVDTITTDADGKVTSKLLHLGEYLLVEKVVPYGFVKSEATPVILGFGSEVAEVVSKSVSLFNERQRAKVSLVKSMEMPENFELYADVEFGIYAKKDVLTIDGDIAIPAGGLLEIFGVDKNGNGVVKTDLPFGSYYVKERKTAAGYVLDTTEYAVIFDYNAENGAVVNIAVNGGKAIENRRIPAMPSEPEIPKIPDTPKTGDDSNLTLWIAVLGASVVALAWLGIFAKRRKKAKINNA